jgi:polar amino acid transport system permease protein
VEQTVVILVLATFGIGTVAAGPSGPTIADTLAKWTPLLGRGFLLNVLISVFAMALGTALGGFVGIGQLSRRKPVRMVSRGFTQVFRNTPWLVLLFYCMLLIPFQIRLGGFTVALPDWLKATFGLSLAVMANVSELVRGALQSIPVGQWDAARSLALRPNQIMRLVILPQCVKRMLPPWMNLYAILVVSTPLCSIVGVNEVMTLTADALNAEARHDLLIPMYLYVLGWFFLYCFPIARWTVALERRFAIDR